MHVLGTSDDQHPYYQNGHTWSQEHEHSETHPNGASEAQWDDSPGPDGQGYEHKWCQRHRAQEKKELLQSDQDWLHDLSETQEEVW